MFCVKCGKELSADSAFCGFCGSPVSDNIPAQPAEIQEQSAPVTVPEEKNAITEASAPVEAQSSVPEDSSAQPDATVVADQKPEQESFDQAQQAEKTAVSSLTQITSGESSENKPFASEPAPETAVCPKCKAETDGAKDKCEQSGAELKPKKRSKKPFVIVLIILLVLALGAAAWYFLFNSPAQPEAEQPDTTTEQLAPEETTEQPEETSEEAAEVTVAEPNYQASRLYGVWQIGGDEGRLIALSKQGSFFQLSNGSFYCGTFVPTEDKLVLSYTNGDETVYGVSLDDGFVLSFNGEYVRLDLIATLDENTNPLLGVWYCHWNDEAVLFADGGKVWASNGLNSSYLYDPFNLTITIGDSEPVACQPSDSTLKVDFEGKGTFFEYERLK